MDQRTFLELVSAQGQVITIDRPVDPCLELAAVSGAIEDEAPGRIVRFRHVIGSEYEVVTGLCADRRHFAAALDCAAPELIFRLAAALADPQPSPIVSGDQAPCQEVIEPTPDLETIPFLTHWARCRAVCHRGRALYKRSRHGRQCVISSGAAPRPAPRRTAPGGASRH